MQRRIPTVLAAALLGLRLAPALAGTATDIDLKQFAVDLGHRYDGDYAAKDSAAMANLFTTDGVLVSPPGPIVRGREAFLAYYQKRFA